MKTNGQRVPKPQPTNKIVWSGHPAMRQFLLPLFSLKPNPNNERDHDERSVDIIATSFKEFGQDIHVLFDGKKTIRLGNGRYLAAKKLGWTHLAALPMTQKGAKVVARAIADNRSAELSTWSVETLSQEVAELATQGFDAATLGFEQGEIDALIEQLTRDEKPEPKPLVPKKSVPIKLGDIYVLGKHRLMCGDSMATSDIVELMDGKNATLLQTDPPYMVGYKGSRPKGAGKNWAGAIHDGESKDGEAFTESWLRPALDVLNPKTAIYIWHASIGGRPALDIVAARLGLLMHTEIVWMKPTLIRSFSVWQLRHESCMMLWKKGDKPKSIRPRLGVDYTTVWEVPYDGGKKLAHGEHPTQKPVELFRRPMKMHVGEQGICYEPFSGSGTQIIAGEELGRTVYAMEIEPVFVDLAIRRWEQMTGKRAKRIARRSKQRTKRGRASENHQGVRTGN